MDDKLPISYQEIIEEVGRLDSRLLELAIERIKNAKLSQALAEVTAEPEETAGDMSDAQDK